MDNERINNVNYFTIQNNGSLSGHTLNHIPQGTIIQIEITKLLK